MSDERYQIVVTGELTEGAYLPDVKAKLAALFNTPLEKLDPLFSGKRVVIKKGLDETAAQKYRATVAAAGLHCIAEAMAAETPAPAMSVAPPGVILVEAPKVRAPDIDIRAYSMAPPGAIMDETPQPAVPDIDTRALSAAPAGEALVESERPAVPDIDTSALSIAPPGSRLADERPVTPLEFDLGDLDLAPAGSDMGEMERDQGAPPPDTSHLKLDN
jgi:hypothetical protein